jgi:hypothetical protein
VLVEALLKLKLDCFEPEGWAGAKEKGADGDEKEKGDGAGMLLCEYES